MTEEFSRRRERGDVITPCALERIRVFHQHVHIDTVEIPAEQLLHAHWRRYENVEYCMTAGPPKPGQPRGGYLNGCNGHPANGSFHCKGGRLVTASERTWLSSQVRIALYEVRCFRYGPARHQVEMQLHFKEYD